MSDHTPTAGIVKSAYVNRTHEVYCADPYEVADDFDRWLAEHDRQIAAEAWEEGFDYANYRHEKKDIELGQKSKYIERDRHNPYRREDQQ